MKILVTGSQGFIAKNLLLHLEENGFTDTIYFNRSNSLDELKTILPEIDFVFHLAGVNRPKNDEEFLSGNTELTELLVKAIKVSGQKIPILYTSSIQADLDNPYGRSKLEAENLLIKYMKDTGSPVYIYRLPNVFGKWCKPNYNSVIATFCNNIANDLPIKINDENTTLSLVYIDDVCRSFVERLTQNKDPGFQVIEPIYSTTLGFVESTLNFFKEGRDTLITAEVGVGFTRALYSTYLSYLSPSNFSYIVPGYSDERGTFVEMLKTKSSGQFSFFTAYPGVTRGGHYHHSKNEKFLIIKGKANYRFKNITSGEYFELKTDANEHRIVETVPGWTHDITNIGDDELIVMLWANENFDREMPDTVASPIL